jgi:hypothetical protein
MTTLSTGYTDNKIGIQLASPHRLKKNSKRIKTGRFQKSDLYNILSNNCW